MSPADGAAALIGSRGTKLRPNLVQRFASRNLAREAILIDPRLTFTGSPDGHCTPLENGMILTPQDLQVLITKNSPLEQKKGVLNARISKYFSSKQTP